MKSKHRAYAGAILVALSSATSVAQAPPESALPSTTRTRPAEFGTESYNVTVIHAASFTSDDLLLCHTVYASLARYFPDFNGHHYFAGLSLPSGAVIDYVGLQSESGSDGGMSGLIATLFYVDRYSGTTSGIVSVPSSNHSGFFLTDFNPSALGWQLASNAHNALVFDVYQAQGWRAYFGWVEVWWHRTVSPPPATATFPDVPTDHPFFQFVEALHAAGITGGYGNGNFGVNDPVTRGQMAVFLAKALGLHWPE